MLLVWLSSLGCGNGAVDTPRTSERRASSVETRGVQPKAAGASIGRIGGAPILEVTNVLGGLEADAVDAVLKEAHPELDACRKQHAEDRRGKVLVRLSVEPKGAVSRASVRSSSLRSKPAEACMLDVLDGLRFPPLQTGDVAVITAPLTFTGAP